MDGTLNLQHPPPPKKLKYCEKSERCYAHIGPYETVKISEVLELTLNHNRPALAYANLPPLPQKKDNSKIHCIF
jgi:hypothetical protein